MNDAQILALIAAILEAGHKIAAKSMGDIEEPDYYISRAWAYLSRAHTKLGREQQ